MKFKLKSLMITMSVICFIAGSATWIHRRGYPSSSEEIALRPIVESDCATVTVVPHDVPGTPLFIVHIHECPDVDEYLKSMRPSFEKLRRFRLNVQGRSITEKGLRELLGLPGLCEMGIDISETGVSESELESFKAAAPHVDFDAPGGIGLPYPIPDDLSGRPV